MELHTEGSRGWNDASCEELRFYVCSVDTRSVIEAQLGSMQSGASLYDVLWTTSERVADEILFSDFLRGMYSRRLPAQRYADFCHQEAIYLIRVIAMLEVLIRTVKCPEDIHVLLERTHQCYKESLLQYQNHIPSHLNVSSIQPSAAVRQYLQSFHDLVNEEPIYWVVSLLPRALLRPYLAKHLPLEEQTTSGLGPCLYPWLSLFPCPCHQWSTDWGAEDIDWDVSEDQNVESRSNMEEDENVMNLSFLSRSLIEKYQSMMSVSKAVKIFRGHMINEKAIFTSSWFPTCDEEEVEDKRSFLQTVESGPDLREKL
ncbi:hypothetical protein UPYG_G00244190 [Umbra pygmaea]|uniref:Uncharacterized protein n=1 Tax=Umbra pygmaea TaxID=75934 RepID=A0ABD0X3U7_UMBPY